MLVFGTLYNVDKPLGMLMAHVRVTVETRGYHALNHGPFVTVTCFPNNFTVKKTPFFASLIDAFLIVCAAKV